MKAEIISLCKHKLVSGFLNETDYVRDELQKIGVSFFSYPLMNGSLVRDSDIFDTALERSDIVFILSPINSEADDKIKKLISLRLGLPLERDFKTLSELKAIFKRNKLDLPESAGGLSFFPKGSFVFRSESALQNGYAVSFKGKLIVCLPDDNKQIWNMYNNGIYKVLSQFCGFYADERKIGIYGLTRGYVKAQLGLKLRNNDNVISVSQGADDVSIRVSSVSRDDRTARENSLASCKSIMEIFGDYVYGIDVKNNAEAMVNELVNRNLYVSLADGATNGELGRRIFEIDGARDSITDYSVFSSSENELIAEGVPKGLISEFSPLSEETAVALGFSSLCFNHSDLAVGIVGKAPSSNEDGLIYLAICDETSYKAYRLELKSSKGKSYEELGADKLINLIRLFARAYPSEKGTKSIRLLLGEHMLDSNYTKKQRPDQLIPPRRNNNNLDLNSLYEQDNEPMEEEALEEESPSKKKGFFKSFLFYLVLCCCILSLTGSIGYIAYYFQSSKTTKSYYNDLVELHYGEFNIDKGDELDIPKGYPEEYDKGFIPLWKKNKDIAGFLRIDTIGEDEPIINYPVVKREGDKNSYYDRRDFDGKYSRYGVPFVDYECDLALPSDNIIIYGHNMKDGQMFGLFESYNSIDYFKAHPTISFDSVYQKADYAIFGVFYASTLPGDNPFNYHCFVRSSSWDEYNSFISEVKKRSIYDVDLDISPGDELITLSTCVYKLPNGKNIDGGRLVLMGRKMRKGETPKQIQTLISENKSPLMPAPYYRDDEENKKIKSVVIKEKDVSLIEGGKRQLSVGVSPKSADISKLKWVSTDEGVCKAYAGGLLEATGKGSCVVSVCDEKGMIFSSINVSVTQKAPNSIEKLYFNTGGETIRLGESFQIFYEYYPKDAKDVTVIFESSDDKILSVDSEGLAWGNSVGRAKVKSFGSDGRFLGEIPFRVVADFVPLTTLSISSPDQTLDVGKQAKLFLVLSPLNATNAEISWESDNPEICSVSKDGKITAISEGKTRIYARTLDNSLSDYINVTVREKESLIPVKEIILPKEISLNPGESKKVSPKALPVNALSPSFSFEIGDSSIASVSKDGAITGISEGTTSLVVSAENGSVTAEMAVKVNPKKSALESLRLSQENFTLKPGEKALITVLTSPENAKVKLSFSSSDSSKLICDKNGNATARAPGRVSLTVTDSLSGLKATANITIEEPINTNLLQKINLLGDRAELMVGEEHEISYTLEPSSALNSDLTFASSNENVARVDSSGRISAVGEGNATILIKARQGDAKAKFIVTVLPIPEESLEENSEPSSKNETPQIADKDSESKGKEENIKEQNQDQNQENAQDKKEEDLTL